ASTPIKNQQPSVPIQTSDLIKVNYSDLRPIQHNKVSITPHLGTWVWRDWISDDGLFFLELRTGVWNPNGTLFYLTKRGGVSVEGFQKGKDIKLKSYDAEIGLEAPSEYLIQGTLDTTLNQFLATIINTQQSSKRQTTFYPAMQTTIPQPQFYFKYYGIEDPEWHKSYITQVDVIEKSTRKVYQTLTGFTAQSYAVQYLDLNYDGYFDLKLNIGKEVSDNKTLVFLYHPESKKFIRDAFFEHT
ncbi:hypothetical protein GWI33_010025, partial [Rhynchophorus ferrugineus]